MKHRKDILLIDRTQALVDACTSILNGRSEVAQETNLESPSESTPKKKFDLVVVSIPTSAKDDLLPLQNVKRRFPGIPLILASDIRSADRIVTALHSGADALVRLPVDPVELFATICRYTYPSGENTVPKFVLHASQDLQTFMSVEKDIYTPAAIEDSLISKLSVRFSAVRDLRRWSKHIRSAHPENKVGTSTLRPFEGYFLGSFGVMLRGVPVQRWRSRKGRSLFAYLLYHHKRPVYRDVLMETFWPDVDPECSRDSLNVTIHHIRQDLRGCDSAQEIILYKDECYAINPDLEVWLDCEAFQSQWHKVQHHRYDKDVTRECRELEDVVHLYKGDFMEEEPYEDWAASERENYREEFLVILERLSEHYLSRGDVEEAASLCERILERDNCRENVHKKLMLCYYRLGCRDKAMKQFRRCADVLQKELNMGPTSATVRLNEDIRQGLVPSEK